MQTTRQVASKQHETKNSPKYRST